MIIKHKVSEIANDLNIDKKDIIDLIENKCKVVKKTTSSLDETELNVVFEHYSQEYQVENFDKYYNSVKEKMAATEETPKQSVKSEAKQTTELSAKTVSPIAEKPIKAPEDKQVKKASEEAVKSSESPAEKQEVLKEVPKELKEVPKELKEVPKEALKEEPAKTPSAPQSTSPAKAVAQTPQVKKSNEAPKTLKNLNTNRPSPNRPGQTRPGQTRPMQNRTPGSAQTVSPRPFNNQNTNGYNNNQRSNATYNNNSYSNQRSNATYNNANANANAKMAQEKAQARNAANAIKFQTPGSKPTAPPSKPAPKFVNNTASKSAQKPIKTPSKAREQFETLKPMGGLGTTPTTEQRFTHVDTRGSYVELDKYNEKYEQIATPKHALKDTVSTKQKIFQKTQRNRRYNRRDSEADKLRKIELEKQRRATLKVTLPEEITVGDLALRLKVTAAEIVKRLMTIGVMAAVSDVIDFDTASMVAMEIGAKVEREVVVTIEERLIDDTDDHDDNLEERSPVVVVMGHVDHGKTSLLDAIRNAHVISTEAGGITQHIGAYRVKVNGKFITFLDTPGHAAFTSMRARGAMLTDIAILVVAADDGIMPQTIEAINHAKAAGVSIIVAINKIDKPAANVDKVKAELAEHELVCEDWGGDIICVPVSARQNENIDTLLEMVQLVADVKELKANPNRRAKGVVIESKLDKGKGPIATVLVQNGTLKNGDALICGKTFGRVRVMTDDKGDAIAQAGPSVPVEISGLDKVPEAGDIFNVVEDEKLAKELVEQRVTEEKEEKFATYKKVTLENLFSQIEEGEVKELPIIVKADVNGSVEAIKQSLEKLSCDEVRVRVIHAAVGAVTESDVMLASASNAIIVGFNVRPEITAKENAARDGVDIRLYHVIYDAINEIETAMKGMRAPKYRDVDLGTAEVRLVYKISTVGTVAGSYVTSGKITRNANIRVVRDGIVIADDKLSSLKRFKDDAKEVAQNFECGMSLEKFQDIKEGDIFEAYIVEEYRD